MSKLSEQTRGRIAEKLLIHKMAAERDGLTVQQIERELPSIAKQTGETKEDVKAFAEEILPLIIAKRFGCKAVSITW